MGIFLFQAGGIVTEMLIFVTNLNKKGTFVSESAKYVTFT